MKAGPLSRAELLLARVRSPPAHELVPQRRPEPRGALKTAAAAVLGPASFAIRQLRDAFGGPGALDGRTTRTIAVVKLDHLGDVVMFTPVFRALRRWAPAARITAYVRSANADVVGRLPTVDEVETADVPWIRPEPGSAENLRACLALARRLRDRRFDLAVDLRYHNRLDSLLLSRCGARFRLGFDAGGFGFGVTHAAPWPRAGTHEAERQAAALRRFGIPVEDLHPEFPLGKADRAAAAKRLGAVRRFAAFHVGTGNAIKRWMPERFAWVGRELARRARLPVAVLAGPGEEALGDPIVRALPKASCLDLRGRLGVFELAAVLERAALFVGNDGGPGHLAAAVGTPAVIVFSGTNEAAEWAPAGAKVRVLEHRVPCKPCASTTCPFDQACLRGVTVDEVLRAALETLGGG